MSVLLFYNTAACQIGLKSVEICDPHAADTATASAGAGARVTAALLTNRRPTISRTLLANNGVSDATGNDTMKC